MFFVGKEQRGSKGILCLIWCYSHCVCLNQTLATARVSVCGKFCSSLHSSHTGEGVPAAKHWGNRLCEVEESPICCQLQSVGGIGCVEWKRVLFAVSCKVWGE